MKEHMVHAFQAGGLSARGSKSILIFCAFQLGSHGGQVLFSQAGDGVLQAVWQGAAEGDEGELGRNISMRDGDFEVVEEGVSRLLLQNRCLVEPGCTWMDESEPISTPPIGPAAWMQLCVLRNPTCNTPEASRHHGWPHNRMASE